MSRIPCKQCGIVPADEAVALGAVTVSNLASLSEYSLEELQLGNPCIQLVLTSKEANQHPNSLSSCDPGDQHLWQITLYHAIAGPLKNLIWITYMHFRCICLKIMMRACAG